MDTKNKDSKFKVLIVGGGPAGLSVLVQLTQSIIKHQLSSQVQLHIVEKDSKIGPGMVYSTLDKAHLTNIPIKFLCIYTNDNKDFYNWLLKNKEKWSIFFPDYFIDKDNYPPRGLFGLYLEDIYQSILGKAKENNIEIISHYCEITNLNVIRNNDKIAASSEKGVIGNFEQIVLCCGHLPGENYKYLAGTPGYFESPWGLNHEKIKLINNGNIAILGSSLTAIDAILSLNSNGYCGEIGIFSRKGLLPRVFCPNIPPNFISNIKTHIKILSDHGRKKINLDSILNIAAELSGITLGDLCTNISGYYKINPLERLISDVEEFEKQQPSSYRSLIESFFRLEGKIWQLLEETSKERFLREYYRLWKSMTLSTTIFPNAIKIIQLIQSGKLKIFYPIENIQYLSKSKNYIIKIPGKELFFDTVINATGSGCFRSVNLASKLLQCLINNGLITQNPHGGIYVDISTLKVIGSEKKLIPNIFAVGELTQGVFLSVDGLGIIVLQSKVVTNQIISHLRRNYVK